MRIAVCATYALLLAAGPVLAQAPNARPDPTDPKALVPSINYRSAFADYRRFDEQKVSDWRGANDLVGKIGGWQVYARESRQPEPARGALPAGSAVGGPAK